MSKSAIVMVHRMYGISFLAIFCLLISGCELQDPQQEAFATVRLIESEYLEQHKEMVAKATEIGAEVSVLLGESPEDEKAVIINFEGNTQLSDVHLADMLDGSPVVLLLSNTKISDEGIAHLRNYTGVRCLALTGTNVGDTSLKFISTLDNLDSLYLGDTQVTENGLEHLAKLKKLEHLVLSGNEIGDEGIIKLATSDSITVLILDGTDVTDLALPAISEMKSIQYLGVSDTRVTHDGIESLLGKKNIDISTSRAHAPEF